MVSASSTSDDALLSPEATYLRDINATPLLNAEQERELARRIRDGDPDARDHLVRANLRLVVNIARSYRTNGASLSDLIAEGNLGLLRAVEAFDPTMNVRFSTYASLWIKQSIKRGLMHNAKSIRIPCYMMELLFKWREASTRLQNQKGQAPSPDEIAADLGLSKKKLHLVRKAIRVYNSVASTDQSEVPASLEATLAEIEVASPSQSISDADDVEQVLRFLETMDQREATVLRMRYGLDDDQPKTLKEIGDALGLTRERVRQIEQEALSKLSDHLSAA